VKKETHVGGIVISQNRGVKRRGEKQIPPLAGGRTSKKKGGKGQVCGHTQTGEGNSTFGRKTQKRPRPTGVKTRPRGRAASKVTGEKKKGTNSPNSCFVTWKNSAVHKTKDPPSEAKGGEQYRERKGGLQTDGESLCLYNRAVEKDG